MTDQTIPAEKVRELIKHFESPVVAVDNREAIRFLRALLPAPPQPTGGLLGRWAKHPEHGDVVCVWDRPDATGCMFVRWVDEKAAGDADGTNPEYVPFDSLTFPHQATKPEEVPAGEAWRVRHCEDGEFNAVKTSGRFPWRFFNPEIEEHDGFQNHSVTLVCPLTPERPGKDDLVWKYGSLQQAYAHLEEECSDLQSLYDALDAKYREAQEKIKALEQPKPAWRIEHSPDSLRRGEYIIDTDDDTGTVRSWDYAHDCWFVLGGAFARPICAPFIAFPNKDAATPEAIAEAKKARDKEIEK